MGIGHNLKKYKGYGFFEKRTSILKWGSLFIICKIELKEWDCKI